MDIYYKISGVWTKVQRPYVKRTGVWTPVKETWRKAGGVWVKVFNWDITPPPPPSIELNLAAKGGGRYLDMAINIPGADQPDVRMIRVLVSTTAYPATQFGGTYYATPESSYPQEPWSDFMYHGDPAKTHSSTNIQYHKQYPINADKVAKPTLAAGVYYFSAWAYDVNGNWSPVSQIQFSVPKTGLGTDAIIRNARFQADYSGSYVEGTGFVTGDLVQGVSPRASRGMYFYGPEIVSEIGSAYGDSKVTINNAQIYLRRIDTDGTATANIYIWRHNYATPGAITTSPPSAEITKLGTLAKGEGKWFSIPTSFHADLIAGAMKGVGFYYKDPSKAAGFAEDYSVISGLLEDNRRQGELYVAWTEDPS